MSSTATIEPTSSQSARSPWLAALMCLAIAAVAATIALFDFCPQFAYWRGVDNPVAHRAPEYGRANALLAQAADPLAKNFDPMHRVLAWRLLFPLTWHYLHLPRLWLLAMPQVGCLLVLWLVAWLTRLRTSNWLQTACATLLFATFSWFFVSTGWLGYFDSWLVLGLLVAAFAPQTWAFAAACALTPWVDERFVLALPVTLLVREAAGERLAGQGWRALARDSAIALASAAPYLLARAAALMLGEQDSSIYAQAHLLTLPNVTPDRFIAGWWSGFRAGWVFVIAAVWLVGRTYGPPWGWLLGAAVAICSVGGLFIAADMSRTVMMVSPALLWGIWLSHSLLPAAKMWLLPAVTAGNLLLPAAHDLWFQHFPIHHFPTELARYRGPVVDSLLAAELIQDAMKCIAEGQTAAGREKLDAAISLQQRYAIAYAQRAALRVRENDMAGAMNDAEEAVKIDATMPYALFIRGFLRATRGEKTGATADLQAAILNGGPNWAFRAQAHGMLEQLQNQESASP